MNREAAVKINSLLLKQAAELKDAIALAKSSCDKKEFEDFLSLTSHSLAIIFDLLDKIYEQYPELKPEELN